MQDNNLEGWELLYALMAIPYVVFVVWLGAHLFAKWLPIINKVEEKGKEEDGFPILDLSALTMGERVKFFYVRMILEVIVLFMLVFLGVNNRPKVRNMIQNKMWRGNVVLLLLIIAVAVIYALPMMFLFPSEV